MKKKISILMSLILSIFLVVGCGKSKGPKDYVNDYFKDLKAGTESEFAQKILNAQVVDDDVPEEAVDAILNMLGKLEVQPESEKIDGDTATVDVKVKGVNIKTVLQNFMSSIMAEAMKGDVVNMSDEESEKLATDLIIKALNETPAEERTGVINLVKSGEEWRVVEDDSLLKVAIGITEEDIDNFLQ